MLACSINSLKSKPVQRCESTAIIDKEVFKEIPNYRNYLVSNLGVVKTKGFKTKHGHFRKPVTLSLRDTQRSGKRVALYNEKGVKYFLVARLVACVFYGYSLRTRLTVNHIDGNRDNNNLGNLELITRQENIRHGYNTGLYDSKAMRTVIRDTETNKDYVFHKATTASRFIGKCKYYISNYVSHNLEINGRYKLVEYGDKRFKV